MEYRQINGAYFLSKDDGSLQGVTDRETLRALKQNQIPYRVEAADRVLQFTAGGPASSPGRDLSSSAGVQGGGVEYPASTSVSGAGGDLQELFKTTFLNATKQLTSQRMSQLQNRRDKVVAQQVAAPTNLDPSKMDPAELARTINQRGAEFQPAVDLVQSEISREKGATSESLQALTAMSDLIEKMSGGKIQTDITDVEGRRVLINKITGETIKDLGSSPTSGTGNNQMTDNERALMTQFTGSPIVKDYNMVVSQHNYVKNILDAGIGGPADLALVFTFMKGLDPNSVVRETEYDNAAKSGNIFKGWAAKFNGYLKDEGGFLPENVKTQFLNLVAQKLKAQTISYENYANSIKEIAKRQGLNPDNVVPNFAGAAVNDIPKSTTPASQFDDIKGSLTVEGDKAYIPRSVWMTLGPRQDALIAEAKADGYQLLVK